MDFRKTTVLPTDSAQARTAFHTCIYDRPQANFVVLGAGPEAEALVAKAGSFAGEEADLRWVIWARDLSAIAAEVETFTEEPSDGSFKKQVLSGGTKGFTVNIQDKICAVIGLSVPLDNVTVVRAFMAADFG